MKSFKCPIWEKMLFFNLKFNLYIFSSWKLGSWDHHYPDTGTKSSFFCPVMVLIISIFVGIPEMAAVISEDPCSLTQHFSRRIFIDDISES